jgi:hypothetical protein
VSIEVPDVNGGTEERAALVTELRDEKQKGLPKLADRIRQAVLVDVGVALARIVFLKPRSIDKTTSGKIQRHKAKERTRDGTYGKVTLAR